MASSTLETLCYTREIISHTGITAPHTAETASHTGEMNAYTREMNAYISEITSLSSTYRCAVSWSILLTIRTRRMGSFWYRGCASSWSILLTIQTSWMGSALAGAGRMLHWAEAVARLGRHGIGALPAFLIPVRFQVWTIECSRRELGN